MQLNFESVYDSLTKQAFWKAGDCFSFSFRDWDLTLRREEDLYKPFTFSISGKRQDSNETIARRYVSMESAFLHVINNFNENACVENKYKTKEDLLRYFLSHRDKTSLSEQIQSACSQLNASTQGKKNQLFSFMPSDFEVATATLRKFGHEHMPWNNDGYACGIGICEGDGIYYDLHLTTSGTTIMFGEEVSIVEAKPDVVILQGANGGKDIGTISRSFFEKNFSPVVPLKEVEPTR